MERERRERCGGVESGEGEEWRGRGGRGVEV